MTEYKVSPQAVMLADAERGDIASARKELAHALDEMIVAVQENKSVQATADGLNEKGWWSAFRGTVSGSNDRDLAGMIKGLGGSLETTQAAVQVMLRLQSRKDHVLREFHSVLVEKIQKIQADTHNLDANQQSAVDVLCEFQEQIEDQLRHHEAVERHEQKIAELSLELTRRDNDLQQGLQSLSDQTASLRSASEHLTTEFDASRKDFETHKVLCIEELAGLKKQYAVATDSLGERLKHLSEVGAAMLHRVELLERVIEDQASLASRLKRHALALLSLVIGGLALAQSVLR